MTNDKTMYFIRNIKALKNEDVESHIAEYEVIADADIIGEFTYGPYYFTIWEISDKQEGEERKLCLRIQISDIAFSADDQPWKSAKRSGFYHGGGIPAELVALASLFLRRRLKPGPIVRMDDSPRLLPKSQGWIDKPLIAGQSNLAKLPEWLKLVEGLDSKYHQRFILAVRLYHQALLLIEAQPDMAYLNLVSAIETLCHDYDVEKTITDLDHQLAELIGSIENGDIRSKIEQKILKRERFIKSRFVAFILDYIEENFCAEKKRPKHGQIKLVDLPDYLERIYDQRSRTLHTGEPLPPSIFSPPMMGAEIDFSRGIIIGEKRWEPSDFIPYPHFFERLVNHVLKSFLKRNQRSP